MNPLWKMNIYFIAIVLPPHIIEGTYEAQIDTIPHPQLDYMQIFRHEIPVLLESDSSHE